LREQKEIGNDLILERVLQVVIIINGLAKWTMKCTTAKKSAALQMELQIYWIKLI